MFGLSSYGKNIIFSKIKIMLVTNFIKKEWYSVENVAFGKETKTDAYYYTICTHLNRN